MTEADILRALQTRYERRHGNGNRYALIPRVRNHCGFTYRSAGHRTADAVLFSLWKSDRLRITGFEIKVSRSDYQQELRNPAKWLGVGKFCDAWYIVTPDGMLDTVPDPWGLMTVDESGKIHIRKRAPLLSPVPLDREFVVYALRRWNDLPESGAE